jgi:hypothetical protein
MSAKTDSPKNLDEQIACARNEIRTDKLDMSYGELSNMYEAEELIISPEYQRLFRWTPTQKSRFIESILLGFPTPAIFVAEDDKGIWELVDGLQRVSTVLEFMGKLKHANGRPAQPSQLVRAGRHPRLLALEDARFLRMSIQARLSIKRAGCRVEVIKTGSKPTMKYEVFERLNTGGSELTPQEVRNCVFRATHPDFVKWVEKLARHPAFEKNLCMSEMQQNTMFDHGLVLRFFTIKNAYREFDHDVEPFITDYFRDALDTPKGFDMVEEAQLFKATFNMVGRTMKENAWRHYRNGNHTGGLSVYVFEAVSTGVAVNLAHLRKLGDAATHDRIIAFKQEPQFMANTGAGANTKTKLLSRVQFARQYFAR